MIKNFKHAFNGIIFALKEKSFRVMFLIALAVFILGFLLNITATETLIIIMTVTLVLGLELINSQVERTLDIISPQKDERVREIKDISAGAVLVASIGSAFIGFIIFLPYLIGRFG